MYLACHELESVTTTTTVVIVMEQAACSQSLVVCTWVCIIFAGIIPDMSCSRLRQMCRRTVRACCTGLSTTW